STACFFRRGCHPRSWSQGPSGPRDNSTHSARSHTGCGALTWGFGGTSRGTSDTIWHSDDTPSRDGTPGAEWVWARESAAPTRTRARPEAGGEGPGEANCSASPFQPARHGGHDSGISSRANRVAGLRASDLARAVHDLGPWHLTRRFLAMWWPMKPL